MPLPKINVLPQYQTKIPSSGTTINFRPYLVKEEKILLLAMETQSSQTTLNAIADIVLACIDENVKKDSLTTFDIEYLFLKIRSKSVGEKSKIIMNCKECNHPNEIEINLDDLKIDTTEIENKIHLTDSITLIMQWPTYTSIINDSTMLDSSSQTEQTFAIVVKCIKSIQTDEENFLIKDTPIDEVMEFIDSLTSSQYEKISNYINAMPKISYEVEHRCDKCFADMNTTLEGMNDFF